MTDRLCLMQVHAHPDDEASKGAGVAALYAAEGIHTVLVTATGGEAGDVLNPEMDTPEVKERLHEVRIEELQRSVDALSYGNLHLLGYRDSGMPDTEANAHPDCFANAPLDEAVERLVRIIRAERPQVIITYSDEQDGYPHPDHIRVHDISIAAFDAAGDADRFPGAGDPFQPLKLYYCGWTKRGVLALHDAALAAGVESPVERWLDRFSDEHDDRYRTRIDVSEHLEAKRAALLAHRTQIVPGWGWMRLPDDVLRTSMRDEEYILARTLVDPVLDADGFESDLFAGIRESARTP